MTVLIGTVSGVFTLDGTPTTSNGRINHLTRHDGSWWAVDEAGRLIRDGAVVATASEGVKLNCVMPAHDTVWVGTGGARLFRLEGADLVEDEFFADAPGRESWYTPWGGPADVRSMAVDAEAALFVNVHVGGILRYDDSGITPTIDIEADVHQVVAHPDRAGLVAAATAWGLAVSSNGHDFEIRSEGLHSRYCRAVVFAGDRLFVSASSGPGGGDAMIYRAALAGGPLEPVRSGLPPRFEGNLDTHCLVTDGEDVYLGNGHSVWRSDDSGDTWTVVTETLPRIVCLA